MLIESSSLFLMSVGGSFQQWEKDVFFSAAEEVQESADVMESIYRMWRRNARDGFDLEASYEFRRELQTALGTAKWQLEEFEKAVKLSHGDNSSDENAITRHRQFVSAIGNQISRVEKGLNDSLIEEGKPPLCWVQLDKEERDDLANFLSGVSRDSHGAKDVAHGNPDLMKSFMGTVTVNKERYVVEVAAKEPSEEKDDSLLVAPQQPYEQTRVLSSPDIGAWKIVIADEDTDKRSAEVRPDMPNHESGQTGSLRSVESTSKLQWFRNNLWKAKNEEPHFLRHGLSYYLDLKGVTRFAQGINGLTGRSRNCHSNSSQRLKRSHSQTFVGKVGRFQRPTEGPQHCMRFMRSVWMTFLLTMSIVLIVPFVLYTA